MYVLRINTNGPELSARIIIVQLVTPLISIVADKDTGDSLRQFVKTVTMLQDHPEYTYLLDNLLYG